MHTKLKFSTLLLLAVILVSCELNSSDRTTKNKSAHVELTPIQEEREEMHREFVKTVEYLKLEKKLRYLSKKDFDDCTSREAEKRIQYSWRLGNVDQLKNDIPLFINSKTFNSAVYNKVDWRTILHLGEHVPSEWASFLEMADRLYYHFKQTGDLQSEQKMLGIKIQGAHLMGDSLNEKKYLQQMLNEIGKDDERYKIYSPMLGHWYQDHGQWKKSIDVFKTQYAATNSNSMLSSLVWGYFNDEQYAEVIKYERKILQLNEHKVNYVLAKSFEELGRPAKAKYYYEKFSKREYQGSRVDHYYTSRNDNKFYLYDHSYLLEVADYFSTIDEIYACRLYQHQYEMIYKGLNSDYTMSIEREVILAQDDPAQQEIENAKYQAKRKSLFNELRYLREQCRECSNSNGF